MLKCLTNSYVKTVIVSYAKFVKPYKNGFRTLRPATYLLKALYMLRNFQECYTFVYSCWRHKMKTFSALLAICAGNSPVIGEFHTQRPVTRSFDVFFDLRLNKRLSKQTWGWGFEAPSRPLLRYCNVTLNLHACKIVTGTFPGVRGNQEVFHWSRTRYCNSNFKYSAVLYLP